MKEEKCVDGTSHLFVHLRQRMEEVSWHNRQIVEEYFCQKCLRHEETRRPKPEERRW